MAQPWNRQRRRPCAQEAPDPSRTSQAHVLPTTHAPEAFDAGLAARRPAQSLVAVRANTSGGGQWWLRTSTLGGCVDIGRHGHRDNRAKGRPNTGAGVRYVSRGLPTSESRVTGAPKDRFRQRAPVGRAALRGSISVPQEAAASQGGPWPHGSPDAVTSPKQTPTAWARRPAPRSPAWLLGADAAIGGTDPGREIVSCLTPGMAARPDDDGDRVADHGDYLSKAAHRHRTVRVQSAFRSIDDLTLRQNHPCEGLGTAWCGDSAVAQPVADLLHEAFRQHAAQPAHAADGRQRAPRPRRRPAGRLRHRRWRRTARPPEEAHRRTTRSIKIATSAADRRGQKTVPADVWSAGAGLGRWRCRRMHLHRQQPPNLPGVGACGWRSRDPLRPLDGDGARRGERIAPAGCAHAHGLHVGEVEPDLPTAATPTSGQRHLSSLPPACGPQKGLRHPDTPWL